MARIFGEIEGYPEGTPFVSRMELSHSGLHRPPMNGISGNGKEGADSIVLSGGYKDDRDFGDIIIYTGEGGRDPKTGDQIADQTLTGGNLGLALNKTNGNPVRVIRGAQHKSEFSPKSGYRYDGLYFVDDYWHENADGGKSKFLVWRFRLVKIKEQVLVEETAHEVVLAGEPAKATIRKEVTTLRIVRDTKKSRELKALYQYRCQICDIQIKGPGGYYAEAAHIQPLGQPHNGPDTFENLLCLCPNHHTMFDLGVFTINDDLTLKGISGQLTVMAVHKVGLNFLKYHRDHYSQ